MRKVYFDSAATTQLREEVIDKMHTSLKESYGNPSSTHSFGRSSKTLIESARKTIAKHLNAKPSEIIFTSGGTEADNMILQGAVRDLGVKTIITSKIEHHAVLHTIEELHKAHQIEVKYVDLAVCGTPDAKHLESLLKADSSKKLVSLMHVNNEVGTMIDIDLIADMCKENDALFHSDAVQSIGHWEWDLQKTKVDFLAAAAHKFHGPKGIGFAFIRKDSGLKSLIFGGAQERGYRAGTESCHNIVGLEESFALAYDNLDEERKYVSELKQYFIEEIKKIFPEAKFNGGCEDSNKSTYTLVNVVLPLDEKKAQILLFHLDINGIACSRGSACQSGSSAGSHVLNEILSAEDLNKPSLRFSFSKFNTKDEIDYVMKVLEDFSKS
ncbi:aminotransferase class V-fold PLP-dependent enzyme [Flavobacteriaceae bacterium R38]|nr:aminotransferase class V-fold PLP-dependent enzyme [Flavobacteriaceae bacterium R38]